MGGCSRQMDDLKRCALALCSLMLVGALLGAADDTGAANVVVTASVGPWVEISAPSNTCTWEISPQNPGTKTKEVTLTIKANCPWKLTAKDIRQISDGYMTEWTGSGYGSKRLSHPVQITSDDGVLLSDSADKPLCQGDMTGDDGTAVTVTLSQIVDEKDLSLPEDRAYRIMVGFDASPSIASSPGTWG